MKRSLPFLLAGLVAGLALGLLYAWVVHPREFSGTAPNSLRFDFQDEYLELIASAYQGTGDLDRARARLALFPSVGPEQLAALAQRLIAQPGGEGAARGLAALAIRMQTPAPALTSTSGLAPTALASPGPGVPLPLTVAPLPTFPLVASPTPALRSLYALVSQQEICDPTLAAPLLEVIVNSSSGTPLPGIEVRVSWQSGEDHFFTGLQPERGVGYGDFTMDPGVTYQVQVGGMLEPIRGLRAPDCPKTDGTTFAGSLRLVLQAK